MARHPQAPRIGTPFEVVLPSGAKVEVRTRVGKECRDLIEAIELGSVSFSVDPWTLPLADANTLETILACVGAIASPPLELSCRNCDEKFEADARAALPLGPLLSPPGDPELDPPVDRVEWHELPQPVAVGRKGSADAFRLSRRTLGDRKRLEEILGDRETPLPLGAPLVRALGVGAFGKGEEPITESPMAIARALEALDDPSFERAWNAITAAWDRQHWGPRLLAPLICPECGARNDLELVERPLDHTMSRGPTHDAPFVPVNSFTARVDELAREIVKDPTVAVVVDDGPPYCDAGGEAAWGTYDAPSSLVEGAPATITLYYRTFVAQWEDGPYDVEAEIRETLEHELEHHQGILAGHDPLGEEEQLEIVRERRRLHGAPSAEQSPTGVLAGSFGAFLRRTWPIWVLILLAFLLVYGGER